MVCGKKLGTPAMVWCALALMVSASICVAVRADDGAATPPVPTTGPPPGQPPLPDEARPKPPSSPDEDPVDEPVNETLDEDVAEDEPDEGGPTDDATDETADSTEEEAEIDDGAEAEMEPEAPGPAAEGSVETIPDSETAPDADAEAETKVPDETKGLVEVTRSGAFNIIFQNTDLRLALRSLSTQGRRNIVASKAVSGAVTATFYDVTFEEALDAICKATGFVYLERENFIYIHTAEEIAQIELAGRPLQVRAFRLSYVKAADALALVAPALSTAGTSATTPAASGGIAPNTDDAGGNDFATDDLLIVRDYQENLDSVAEILKQVDVRPQQVLIEATILTARLDETNALGINFAALHGIDFESLGADSTGVGNVAEGGIAADEMKGVRAGQVRTDFTVVDGGLSIGFISNNVAAFVSALETITDLTVLANPKLLVVNKQRGEVLIGSRDGYRTTVVNEGISTENIEFLETGTKLIVRPYIANDGYIRLEIHPEDSDGSISDGLPTETTTQVTSNVLIKDGRTIVVGGLFREETQEERSQIPLLGNIKHVGALFRHTSDMVDRREVIIVITPHIIRHDTDEAISDQIRDDIERFRVGQRKGLRWWGRSQVALSYMRNAQDALRQGRRDKALWYTDMTLSLDPRLLEAIRLKERLTEEAYWAREAEASSAKNVIQRMMMEELKRPGSKVIYPNKPLDGKGLKSKTRKAFGIRRRREVPLPETHPSSAENPREQVVKADTKPADESKDAGDSSAPAEGSTHVKP
ncbi:MAG: secretin N-terminal domain-containing protein [Planctomycetota bacterium]|jgi:type IV pilus assembly protein PilQ